MLGPIDTTTTPTSTAHYNLNRENKLAVRLTRAKAIWLWALQQLKRLTRCVALNAAILGLPLGFQPGVIPGSLLPSTPVTTYTAPKTNVEQLHGIAYDGTS